MSLPKIIKSRIPYGGGKQYPDTIIVHSMAEYVDNEVNSQHAVAFLNEIKLSEHYLVSPSSDVYQCREENEIAWHARGFNTNSIGVGFLVKGHHNYESFLNEIKTMYVEEDQFNSGVELVKGIISRNNITTIKRHSDVSPGRKVDPGTGFPWDEFLNAIRA